MKLLTLIAAATVASTSMAVIKPATASECQFGADVSCTTHYEIAQYSPEQRFIYDMFDQMEQEERASDREFDRIQQQLWDLTPAITTTTCDTDFYGNRATTRCRH